MKKKQYSVFIKCAAEMPVEAYTDKQAAFLAMREWLECVDSGAVNDADAWEVVEIYEDKEG